jgi:hypothetical protein
MFEGTDAYGSIGRLTTGISFFYKRIKAGSQNIFLCGFTDYVYYRTTKIVLAIYWTPGMDDRPSKGQDKQKKVNTTMRKVEFELTITEFERFTTGQALGQQPR